MEAKELKTEENKMILPVCLFPDIKCPKMTKAGKCEMALPHLCGLW